MERCGHAAGRTSLLVAASSALAMVGCSMHAPQPIGPDRGAIGIQIEHPCPTILPCQRPLAVIFVAVPPGDNLKAATTYYISNFNTGNHYYLVNVAPGRYAAVASEFSQNATLPPLGLGGPQQPETPAAGSAVGDFAYFDTPLVQQSLVTVESGKLAYAGTAKFESRDQVYDDTQRTFTALLQGRDNPTMGSQVGFATLSRTFGGVYYYSWSAHTVVSPRGREDEVKFLRAAVQDLKGSSWSAIADAQAKAVP